MKKPWYKNYEEEVLVAASLIGLFSMFILMGRLPHGWEANHAYDWVQTFLAAYGLTLGTGTAFSKTYADDLRMERQREPQKYSDFIM